MLRVLLGCVVDVDEKNSHKIVIFGLTSDFLHAVPHLMYLLDEWCELGCLHTAPIRTPLGPLPTIGVITRKFYGFNMHWPSDIMTSGHSNMLRK